MKSFLKLFQKSRHKHKKAFDFNDFCLASLNFHFRRFFHAPAEGAALKLIFLMRF